MKAPRLVFKVAHCDIEVSAMDPVLASDVDARGLYVPDRKRIRIDPGAPAPDQAATLLHELMHAIYDCYSLNFAMKKREEEEVCRGLDVPLATLFRDNPHLHAVLMAALNKGVPVVRA